MSIKTWKDEFFSIPLYKTNKGNCVSQAIRKWEGLSKKNLLKHNLYRKNVKNGALLINRDNEDDTFLINYSSCSLCYNYYDKEISNHCIECPLSKGGNKSDRDVAVGCEFAYSQFRFHGRNTYMLNRLKNIK